MSKTALAIVLVMLAAFGVLLAYAGTNSLWYDDIAQLGIVAPPRTFGDVMETITRHDIFMPPLSFVLTWVWMRIAPYGTAWLRLPCILIFCLAVGMQGWLGLKAGGKRAGILCAVLAGTCSSTMVGAAYTLRAYSLFIFFSSLTMLLYYRRLSHMGRESRRELIAYGVALLLLTYTHYFGVFIVAALGVMDLFLLAMRRIRWRVACSYVMWGLLFLPWFVMVFARAEQTIEAFGQLPPTPDKVLALIKILSGYSKWMLLCPILAVLLLAWGGAKAFWARRMDDSPSTILYQAALLCISLSIGVVYMYSAYIRPERGMFIERYFFGIAPMVALLTAFGLDWVCKWLDRQRLIPHAGAILCAAVIVGLYANEYGRFIESPRFVYATYEQAADWIYAQEDAHRDDSVTLVRHGYPLGVDYYYTHNNTRPPINLIFDVAGHEERLLNARRVYLNQQHASMPQEIMDFFQEHFTLVDEMPAYDIWVFQRKGT